MVSHSVSHSHVIMQNLLDVSVDPYFLQIVLAFIFVHSWSVESAALPRKINCLGTVNSLFYYSSVEWPRLFIWGKQCLSFIVSTFLNILTTITWIAVKTFWSFFLVVGSFLITLTIQLNSQASLCVFVTVVYHWVALKQGCQRGCGSLSNQSPWALWLWKRLLTVSPEVSCGSWEYGVDGSLLQAIRSPYSLSESEVLVANS